MLAPQGGVNILPTFSWLSSTGAILQFDWQNLLQVILGLTAVYILLGRYFIKGLLAGSVKG